MFRYAKKQRSGRIIHWMIGSLALLAGAMILNRFFRITDLERLHADPVLLEKLQTVSFEVPDNKDVKPGEWPQWRGPRRDGVSTETGLLTDWPKDGPKVLWKAAAPLGFSCVAVSGGRVFTIVQDDKDEAVVCWEAESGKEIWRFKYPARFNDENFGSGPRSTPTVDGDRVYTVGATGILHCLKADKGEKLWGIDLLKEFNAQNLQWAVSFSPLIVGDAVFINPGGAKGNSIAALNKKDGKLIWKVLDDVAGYSSPVSAKIAGVPQIVFFTGNAALGVAPADGKLLWRYPWKTDYDANIATPIVLGDYVFISSGYDKGCALLEISADGKDSFKAKPVYEHNRMRNHFSSCVLYKEHLYGFDETTLACMEFRTGKIKWTEKGFKKGSLTIADGHLIILGEQGKLAVAEAAPGAYKEKASFQVLKNKCWTVPVLANGKLYVRNEEEILCLDLKTK